METKQTPLIDLLERVPQDARCRVDEPDGMGSVFIRVGRLCHEAASALRAALAEPQEPVAWGMRHSDGRIYDCIAPGEHDREPGRYTVPLYTHPAQQRQPLTEDEAWDMWEAVADRGKKGVHIVIDFARAIERAHGIGGQDDKSV